MMKYLILSIAVLMFLPSVSANVYIDGYHGWSGIQAFDYIESKNITVYRVKTPINESLLNKSKLYICLAADFERQVRYYSQTEIELLKNFFENGGAILFIGGAISPSYMIINGFTANYNITLNPVAWGEYSIDKISTHPLTKNISKLYISGPNWIILHDNNSLPLMWNGTNIAMVLRENRGKLIVFADEWPFGSKFYESEYDHVQLMENILSYTLEEVGEEGLIVNVTGTSVSVDGLLKLDFGVFFNEAGVVGVENVSVTYDGLVARNVSLQDLMNGSYTVQFMPKAIGNLTLMLEVFYNGLVGRANTSFVYTTAHHKNVLIVTDDDFWNILYAILSGYPVLRHSEGLSHINDYVKNAKIETIFSFVPGFGDFVFSEREFIFDQWRKNGVVVIDENKTHAILGASFALLKNYSITKRTDVSGNVFCVFNCSIDNAIILNSEDLMNEIKNAIGPTNKFIAVYTESNISALTPYIVEKFGAVPIVFSNIDELNKTVETIKKYVYNITWTNDVFFTKTIYLVLLGIPSIRIEDPGGDGLNNEDGDYIYTDNPYGDIDMDVYQDLAIGRIQRSIELMNYELWKPTKEGLIMSEYRVPEYLVIFDSGGMEQGFLLDFFLSFSGYNFKRLVEHRLAEQDEETMNEAREQYLSWKNIEKGMIDTLLQTTWVGSLMNLMRTVKYSILEHDWKNWSAGIPEKLEEINNETVMRYIGDYNIVFFFGVGNQTAWFMPGGDDLLNPYQGTPVEADKIHFKKPTFFWDAHTLSAYSNFYNISNFVFLGYTGISHNSPGLTSFPPFVSSILHNHSIGHAVKEMKNTVLFWNPQNNLITGTTLEKPIRRLQKEALVKMLFGLPFFTLDPLPISYNNNINITKNSIHIRFSTPYSVVNNSLIFFNASYYIVEPELPILPVYSFSIILPTNLTIDEIEQTMNNKTFSNISVPLFQDYNFSGNPLTTPLLISIDKNLDNTSTMFIKFIPVIYSENQTTVIEELILNISYTAPLILVDLVKTNRNLEITAFGNETVTMLLSINNNVTNTTWRLEGLSKRYVPFPSKPGNYTVSVVLKGNNIAGPITKYFEIKPPEPFVGRIKERISPTVYEKTLENFFERVRLAVSNGTTIYEYWNTSHYIQLIKSSTNSSKLYITSTKYFTYQRDSTKELFYLITPDGFIKREVVNGTTVEDVFGEITQEDLDLAVSEVNEAAERLIPRISASLQ